MELLPAFTSKRSLGCFSYVLHNISEGKLNMQLVVVRPRGNDLQQHCRNC